MNDLELSKAVKADAEKTIAFLGLSGRDAEAYRFGVAFGVDKAIMELKAAKVFRPMDIDGPDGKMKVWRA